MAVLVVAVGQHIHIVESSGMCHSKVEAAPSPCSGTQRQWSTPLSNTPSSTSSKHL